MLVHNFKTHKKSSASTHPTEPNDKKKTISHALLKMESIIDFVHTRYLAHAYDSELKELYAADWELQEGPVLINRPNHGLAHTLRCAYTLPTVAQFYQKHSKNTDKFQFTHSQIKKMQIAMLFSVVGRKNDMGFLDHPNIYRTFRVASANIFEQYCKKHLMHLFKTEKEIKKYKYAVLNFGDPLQTHPRMVVMRQCHKLDLLRCYSQSEFNEKVKYPLGDDLGHHAAQKLVDYSSKLIKHTGDRIFDGPDSQDYDFAVFEKCSKNANDCLSALAQVSIPCVNDPGKYKKKC